MKTDDKFQSGFCTHLRSFPHRCRFLHNRAQFHQMFLFSLLNASLLLTGENCFACCNGVFDSNAHCLNPAGLASIVQKLSAVKETEIDKSCRGDMFYGTSPLSLFFSYLLSLQLCCYLCSEHFVFSQRNHSLYSSLIHLTQVRYDLLMRLLFFLH